ncbi:hypothetical protein TIFTF001_027369 [Ficus carica]|uniref:Uncharacterized protein n=1 Tax=Ficus carica TaxID=3494 RepID=A0AA88DN90_FICCA|nr:hypothetical protein TIFTF001_027369 [Ficus carica]
MRKTDKKSIRKMIAREESPEVELFPTPAQVSKETQETLPLQDSPAAPTRRALHKNSTTEESLEANAPPLLSGKLLYMRKQVLNSRAKKTQARQPYLELMLGVGLTRKRMEKLEEVEHATPLPSTNVKEDALTRVLGPEKHGRLRGIGKEVSLSKLSFMWERDEPLNSLEEKYEKVLEQLIHMNGLVNLFMKNQSSSDKSGSEAKAPAPVPMVTTLGSN